MMSVINQTRRFVRENRTDINAIKHDMEVLVEDIGLVSDNLSILAFQIRVLEISRHVDIQVAMLEVLREITSTESKYFT